MSCAPGFLRSPAHASSCRRKACPYREETRFRHPARAMATLRFAGTQKHHSAEFEQNPITAARVIPLNLSGLGRDNTAGAAFEAAIHCYFDLALVVEAVAASRACIGQRKQSFRWNLMRAHLDVRASRIHEVTVLVELLFNFGAEGTYFRRACHRHALASLNASPIRPGSVRPLRNDLRISFSLVLLSAPSTRNQVWAAALTSRG